ncbi:hypothetical protein BDR07DRAFT_1378361 [Suillus spraguei]|nr:hypothetical protein BDR07DRAFT_1378361 [Suillus spraguei]
MEYHSAAQQIAPQPRNYDPYGPGFFQESTNDLSDAHPRGLKCVPESNDHRLQPERHVNPWYPFDGPGEWSLAKFLVENLSQTQIEQFLKLELFKTREQPQFKSKDKLFYYLKQLPGRGLKWQCTEFRLKGYETEQPIHLIWRDSLEVVKQLFQIQFMQIICVTILTVSTMDRSAKLESSGHQMMLGIYRHAFIFIPSRITKSSDLVG